MLRESMVAAGGSEIRSETTLLVSWKHQSASQTTDRFTGTDPIRTI
jgi:hypothetical protein